MTKLSKWLVLLVAVCGVYVFFQVDKIMENHTDIMSHHIDQIEQATE